MELSPLDIAKVVPDFGAPTLQGFDTSNIQDGQRIKGSGRQFVRFYRKIVPEIRAKEVKTNPKTGEVTVVSHEVVNVEKEFVLIVTPGDKNTVDDVATDWHKREFWPQYRAFREGKTAPLGKDVDECTYISPSVATELKYLGCHTEEQLADASDLLCNQIADGWRLREMARAMCQTKQGASGVEVSMLKSELEKSQEVIRNMQAELGAMKGMILAPSGRPIETSDIVEEVKKRRGRPPKRWGDTTTQESREIQSE